MYKWGIASNIHINFLIKKSGTLTNRSAATHTGTRSNSTSENQQWTEKLHETNTQKFNRRKVCSFFKDFTWDFDLEDMKIKGKYYKRIPFLKSIIYLFS